MMNNGTTTQAYIIANGKRVELESASNDELFSARAYGWRCVLSSIRPKNQYGQNYQGIGFGELVEYKNKLINQYGLLEVEAEIIRRKLDPKSKNYNRVEARSTAMEGEFAS
jgi:hypothetical protein